jgi:hypothetical protein
MKSRFAAVSGCEVEFVLVEIISRLEIKAELIVTFHALNFLTIEGFKERSKVFKSGVALILWGKDLVSIYKFIITTCKNHTYETKS